jgi:hypothetical protein
MPMPVLLTLSFAIGRFPAESDDHAHGATAGGGVLVRLRA